MQSFRSILCAFFLFEFHNAFSLKIPAVQPRAVLDAITKGDTLILAQVVRNFSGSVLLRGD